MDLASHYQDVQAAEALHGVRHGGLHLGLVAYVERERGEYDWEKEYADKATIMRDCWERPEKARGW